MALRASTEGPLTTGNRRIEVTAKRKKPQAHLCNHQEHKNEEEYKHGLKSSTLGNNSFFVRANNAFIYGKTPEGQIMIF